MNDKATIDSAAAPAALPEQTAGVNAEPSTSLSTAPPQPSDHGASGERAAGRLEGSYLDEISGDVQRLMHSSESVGYERGYLACLAELVEHVTLGLKVDGEYLSGLLYRPLLCQFCREPLTKAEREMDDTCSEHARKGMD